MEQLRSRREIGAALVGRRAECRIVDRLLKRIRTDGRAVLLVRGEAGIGKTAILEYGVSRATGMRVLRAKGVASESEMPFSSLSELLRPLIDRIDELPKPQASALAGALAIGPPVGADRFAVSAATLTLLALAAETAPVLVAIDDLQWVDTASAEALLFATRRLDAEPVAMLLALRDGEPMMFDTSGLPELPLEGLDPDASVRLLAASAPGTLVPEVAKQLAASTAGNPLALIETPSLLSDDQLTGRTALDDPLPAGVGIARAYSCRLDNLDSGAQTALIVSAADDTHRLETILPALRELGVEPAALERAESAGLVTIEGGRLEFRHPLLRSCVYSRCSAADRRAAHRALASAYANSAAGDAADRHAWHLSSAAIGPDAATAAALAEVAMRAQRRHGYAAAARAFERAAALSPHAEQRAVHLLAAAEASQLANRASRAAELLDDAGELAREPLLRVRIQHLRAKINTWRGPPVEAYELLIADVEALEDAAPEAAASMCADAVLSAIVSGDIRRALAAARRAYELARRVGGTAELIAALQLGKALILAGEAHTGHPLIMRCAELLDEPEPLAYAGELAQCAPALMTVEEYATTDRVLTRVIEAARGANALGLLPYCLGAQSELEVRVGRWTSAYANGVEAVLLAREAGQEGQLSYNLARLARLEAARGRDEPCRAAVAEALALAGKLGFGSTFPFARSALGLLELGLGHPASAIEHLQETGRRTEAMGLFAPGRLEWAPDLIEAYVRSGRLREAGDALAALETGSEASVATGPLAAAARCRGLLAGDDEFADRFEEALTWHERTATPFERARSELCYGERLRRARRRAEARAPLRSALEAFVRLGAAPWAGRARAELIATGQTVRSREVRISDDLTPQELQVALIVTGGATNKEAGAALFLTPKTIEFHLAKIYRKLGVRSRTQLACRFAGEREAVPLAARVPAGRP